MHKPFLLKKIQSLCLQLCIKWGVRSIIFPPDGEKKNHRNGASFLLLFTYYGAGGGGGDGHMGDHGDDGKCDSVTEMPQEKLGKSQLWVQILGLLFSTM